MNRMNNLINKKVNAQRSTHSVNIARKILLNPGPATTTDAVKMAQVVPDICPREHEFGDMVAWIQDELVNFVGSRKLNVCVLIGGSGTAAVEMVVSSVVPPHSGLFVINNGAYSARIIKIAQIYNIPVVAFESSNSEVIDYVALEKQIIQSREMLANKQITLTHLAVIHHETTSGLLNDISRISALCKKHNLTTIVDAMSSYGAMTINMDVDGIHYLISSSNKNLQGMAGIGIVICNKKSLEQSKDVPMRNLYLNLYDQYAHFLKTKQFRFTPPVQTMYALKQAIVETKTEMVDRRHLRYMESYHTLRSGMEDLGFRVLVADKDSSMFITTFFDPQDAKYSFSDMHDYLYELGYTIYPGKVSQANTFRIANIGDIDASDILRFLEYLKCYLKERKIVKI